MKSFKKICVYVMMFILLLALCAGCSADIDTQDANSSVNVLISCATIVENYDSSLLSADVLEIIGADGVFFDAEVKINEGATAYDALVSAMNDAGIIYEVDTSWGEENAYFVGVNNVYAGDCGELSGWMFFVNNEMPDVSAGSYELNAGDTVELLYSTDMGADLGYSFE